MPTTSVSAACTSSSLAPSRPARSRPLLQASAIARSVRILGRDSPAPASCLSSRASRTPGSNGRQTSAVRVPDRRRARHRDLLADDDAGQALEAGRTPPQRRVAGRIVHVAHDGALAPQRAHALADVVVRCNDPRHGRGRALFCSIARAAGCFRRPCPSVRLRPRSINAGLCHDVVRSFDFRC